MVEPLQRRGKCAVFLAAQNLHQLIARQHDSLAITISFRADRRLREWSGLPLPILLRRLPPATKRRIFWTPRRRCCDPCLLSDAGTGVKSVSSSSSGAACASSFADAETEISPLPIPPVFSSILPSAKASRASINSSSLPGASVSVSSRTAKSPLDCIDGTQNQADGARTNLQFAVAKLKTFSARMSHFSSRGSPENRMCL